MVGVSSHVAVTWFASFGVTPTGPWLRCPDPWSAVQFQALFAGANGGFGWLQYVPTTVMRMEVGAALSATTSFCLVESRPALAAMLALPPCFASPRSRPASPTLRRPVLPSRRARRCSSGERHCSARS
jgi:hypothetical protein